MEENKLALGCGDNYRGEGWIHLDISDLDHVDVVHDLETGKLPFDSNEFNEVHAVHVLEHLSKDALVSLLKEVNRVTRPDGLVRIVMPHFLSWNASDIDHYRAASRKSFVEFCEDYSMNSPHPTIFEEVSIEYEIMDYWVYKAARYFFPTNPDERVAQLFPNAVNEIEFWFRNLEL